MTFNSITMIQQKVRDDFDTLLATVTDGPACAADQMERHLFQQLLVIGANLLQLYFDIQAAAQPRTALVTAAGETLPYHSEKTRSYYAIFGELEIRRPYFYRRDVGSASPLDATLGLGADSYSDFLRELCSELGVYLPYTKGRDLLDRWLGIRLSTRCTQAFIEQDAADVTTYYEQAPAPPPAEEESILVLQSDGKGVPMVTASANTAEVRLKRGQARSRKKAATVTTLYTIAPAPRTVADVMATLLKDGDRPAEQARTGPQHKQIWGTMQGKAAALNRLQDQVHKRNGDHIQERVMLCDGDKSLQAHLLARFPGYSLILDFIHAYESLWQVANVLFGQDDPARQPWVVAHTHQLLNGQALALATSFRERAQAKRCRRRQQKILHKVANYFEANQPYMDYATYLANGWPIASGVIEGACRHFVKDRLELSGMRWSLDGAENLLHLRAVAENHDWDMYHRFRKQQRQQRLYQCDWPAEMPLPTLSRPVRRANSNKRPVALGETSQTDGRLSLAC